MKRRGTYAYSKSQPGRKNGMWKENPKYSALHEWLGNNKPKPARCEICGKKNRLDAANISGKYTRRFRDYKWVCRSCHNLIDDRASNFKPCVRTQLP
jgi:uncharacterized protein YlaI